MKTLVKNRFDNIVATISNSRKNIDLDLMNKNKKTIYKEILGKIDDTKRDLDNNIIDKSIYVFF